MTQNHSPLPWVFDEITGDVVAGEEEMLIHRSPEDNDDRDEELAANSAFIVRACNAHDDLVAALAALEALVTARDEEPSMLTDAEWSAARAAIAKAQQSRER